MRTVTLEAPMAGSVKELLVTLGEVVSEGQELVIIESMKMEIPIESPSGGTDSEICVSLAQSIEEGIPLIRITAA